MAPTLAAIAFACLPALPAAAVDWTYTVRPGDSAWTIARRFCREKTCWRAVARHNGMAAAALPRAGQRLRIPVVLLSRQPISATASVVAGEAWLRRRGSPERRLASNELLVIDDSVRTAAGTVTVRFGDGSELVVGPESEIRFDMLGAFGDGGMVDTQVRALRGRVEPRVKPRAGGSSFRIVTPTGTAVVRGTEFRIRAETGLTAQSFAELTRGSLAFDGTGGSTELAAGFGLVAAAGRAPPPPEALLPAPGLAAGDRARSVPIDLRWSDVPGAHGYRVLLFRPGTEAALVSVHDTPDAGILLSPAPGAYRIVVRAIAASGLEGLDGAVELTALQGRPAPTLAADGLGAVWPAIAGATAYGVELARDPAFPTLLANRQVDVPEFRAELPPGRSWLRVRALTALGATAYSVPLALDRAPPALTLTASTRSWNSAAWRLDWTPVPGARYRLQFAPDAAFGAARREILTELRSWSLSCPFASCSVRVRAEFPTPVPDATTPAQADAVAGPWSATVQVGGSRFLRMFEPRG